MILWMALCGCFSATDAEPGDKTEDCVDCTETSEGTSGTEDTEGTDVVECRYAGCDERCEEAVGTGKSCTDTYAAYEVCYDFAYKRCERQPDGDCGWTMVDQAGWDACVADAKL